MLFTLLQQITSGDFDTREVLISLFVLVFAWACCLPIHECAHALVADKLGDHTARLQNRITLNPLAHLDPIGTVMMLVFGFGYAKPVPVNIRNFPPKKRKFYFGLTALAGPLSNLLLAILFSLLSWGSYVLLIKNGFVWAAVAEVFFDVASRINIMLAIFNLVPIPPLDGSRIMTAVLPDKYYYKIMQYERYLMYGLFAVIFILHRLNLSPLSFITDKVHYWIVWLTHWPFTGFFK